MYKDRQIKEFFDMFFVENLTKKLDADDSAKPANFYKKRDIVWYLDQDGILIRSKVQEMDHNYISKPTTRYWLDEPTEHSQPDNNFHSRQKGLFTLIRRAMEGDASRPKSFKFVSSIEEFRERNIEAISLQLAIKENLTDDEKSSLKSYLQMRFAIHKVKNVDYFIAKDIADSYIPAISELFEKADNPNFEPTTQLAKDFWEKWQKRG